MTRYPPRAITVIEKLKLIFIFYLYFMGKPTAETEIMKIGEREVIFYPSSHRYKVEGEWVTSVSTICGIIDKSRVLMGWACRLTKDYLLALDPKKRTNADIIYACDLYNTKSTEAKDVGTTVHEFCELYIKSHINNEEWDVESYLKSIEESFDLSADQIQAALNGINAFVDWTNSHEIEWIGSERCVYSPMHKFVGTFDALARIDGVLYLIDFKTSSRINDEYALQTAAYVQALSEEIAIPTTDIGRKIIRFDKKTGEFGTFDFKNFENDFTAFKSALSLHNALKSIRAELKA